MTGSRPDWLDVLVVGCGGGVGACGRYWLGRLVQAAAAGTFPLGTLVVNVLGCLLFGLAFELLSGRGGAVRLQLFLTTGLLGGFTTYSTFSQEAVELARAGERAWAAAYAGLSLTGCLVATAVGVGIVVWFRGLR